MSLTCPCHLHFDDDLIYFRFVGMVVRISLPRVRFSGENGYSNRPGYHDVQYELIFMSNQNLMASDSVREAVMRFSSDIYFMEAFAADFIHRLTDAVKNSAPASEESVLAPQSDSSLDSESSSSGIFLSF